MDSTSEDKVLLARVADAVELCEKHCYPHFIGFLDERQQAMIPPHLKRSAGISWLFFGGHEQAERVYLGVFPEFMETDTELFPLLAVTFRDRKSTRLNSSHA